MRALIAAAAILLVLTSCSTQPSEPASAVDPDPVSDGATAAGADPSGQPTSPSAPDPPSPTPPPPPSADILAPTPAVPEAPFYPDESERPSDRDNDLLLLSGSPVIASGDPLAIEGQLLDLTAAPVTGATIELWQSDAAGVYLHPDDPSAAERDSYFQSYGETSTDLDGVWRFRTIVPGPHDGEPRQLHVKVTLAGRELLTTRLYFAEDPALASDPTALELEDGLVALTLVPEPDVDEVGFALQAVTHNLIVDTTP